MFGFQPQQQLPLPWETRWEAQQSWVPTLPSCHVQPRASSKAQGQGLKAGGFRPAVKSQGTGASEQDALSQSPNQVPEWAGCTIPTPTAQGHAGKAALLLQGDGELCTSAGVIPSGLIKWCALPDFWGKAHCALPAGGGERNWGLLEGSNVEESPRELGCVWWF